MMDNIVNKNALKRAKATNSFMTIFFYIIAGIFLFLLLTIFIYILYAGFHNFSLPLLAFNHSGIGNQLFNTIYLVVLALLFSTPVGMLAGIYMAEYAKPGKLLTILRMCIETLSSLPSIVVGLFGYLVFIVMTGMQWNLLAGALAVSILNLPLIASTTEDALRTLPIGYKQGSYGLGATKWQTIWHILLPAAIPQIMTGVILAAGRTLGEAAALMFTAGMSTDISWKSTDITSPTNPWNPIRSGETLALYIWGARTEALNMNAEQMANLSAAILLLLILVFNLSARLISKYLVNYSQGK